LGNATVSGIVRELLATGFLREARHAADGPGRPRIMLTMDPETHLVAGAIYHLGEKRVELQVSNLVGTVFFRSEMALPDQAGTGDITAAISGLLTSALAQDDLIANSPALLGICLPAMVDAQNGIVHWLPPSEPEAYPMAEILRQQFGIPIFLDNYCNVVARAERWFGETTFSEDLCVIFVGAGVGLAQYVGGTLHRGSHGLNSEFGHTKTGIGSDAVCLCGAKGCLVQSSGFVALAAIAQRAFGLDIDPLTDFDRAFGEIALRSSQGDQVALSLCNRAAQALGVAIANHIALWDPSRILVVTPHPDWAKAVGQDMLGYIKQNLPTAMNEMVSIAIRCAPAILAEKGVAALAIDEMMNVNDLRVWRSEKSA
jgi:predicted NBD/HSP70 family sugar kinase